MRSGSGVRTPLPSGCQGCQYTAARYTIAVAVKRAIETRLAVSPHLYGEPLRKTLKGYWKLRVGDYRVVYKIAGEEVWVLGIIHRKDVYENIPKRT